MDAAASAFQFICMDRLSRIPESMECVKANALDVQPECEAQCEVQSRMIDDASSNKLDTNKIDSKCRIGEKSLLDSLLSPVCVIDSVDLESAS
ncbi:hypothetical protein COOONC_19821 [Cooperia oncophora]